MARWRLGVGVVGLLCLTGGIVAIARGGYGSAWVFVVWGAILFFGLLYERIRYKGLETRVPGAGWERTAERFVDPATGKTVTVYIEPATGERKYVAE